MLPPLDLVEVVGGSAPSDIIPADIAAPADELTAVLVACPTNTGSEFVLVEKLPRLDTRCNPGPPEKESLRGVCLANLNRALDRQAAG